MNIRKIYKSWADLGKFVTFCLFFTKGVTFVIGPITNPMTNHKMSITFPNFPWIFPNFLSFSQIFL